MGFELYCQLLKQSVAALKGEKVKPRVEVQARFDFLALNPGEETREAQSPEPRQSQPERLEINVPREVASYTGEPEADFQAEAGNQKSAVERTPAFIPLSYIAEARQRIEIYRKLAQAGGKGGAGAVAGGIARPLRPAARGGGIVAAGRRTQNSRGRNSGITVIEVKEDKLMLTRNNDYIMLGGKFPRLTKKEAKARLKEIKKLLLAL